MTFFNSHLGLQAGEDGSVVLDTRPEHQVAPETIHFAVLTTLAEVAAAQAVGVSVVPAAITVNLMARARPGRLVGRGRLLRRGKRLAVAEGEVLQGDELVAKATVTFAVL
ncbi:MAG TPA: acyl-CoA thioesterase domain-containing protein [Thermoanaerobaculia bacterium]|nr:acyl-CoA thioesterase domain-containing protein [Thermoanaerobaculia bacterium]